MKTIVERIEAASGVPDLVEILATRIEPTDLQSLLIEVYRRRAVQRSPAQVLGDYGKNRFVRPAEADRRALAEWERVAMGALDESVSVLELSPLAPLGACSVIAGVSQDWSVATTRNSEVVSDVTNVLALEAALRRKAAPGGTDVHLATSQRAVRPQAYRNPRLLPHFRLFGMVSAGRVRGHFDFEAEALARHVDFYLRVLRNYLGSDLEVQVSWTVEPRLSETAQAGIQRLAEVCATHAVALVEDSHRTAGRGYYSGFSFHISGRDRDGAFAQLVDGGTVDWCATLLSNAKERTLISGTGSDRIIAMRSAVG